MRSLRIASVLVVLGIASSAVAKESAVDRTKGLISALKKVKAAPEGGTLSAADQKANEAVYKELDGFFNFDRLAGDPLTQHKAKFKGDQLKQTVATFTELIRLISYPRAGTFFRDATYTLKAGKTEGNIALVDMPATIEKEDFKVLSTYTWQDDGQGYKLVDLAFDGASLIKDYQNQFGRIIEKEGVEGLLKKLTARLDKERKKPA
jgi:phospholipid transport system substrate-binding protein